MLTASFKNPVTLVRYRQGPAGPELEEFAAWHAERGYRRGSSYRLPTVDADTTNVRKFPCLN